MCCSGNISCMAPHSTVSAATSDLGLTNVSSKVKKMCSCNLIVQKLRLFRSCKPCRQQERGSEAPGPCARTAACLFSTEQAAWYVQYAGTIRCLRRSQCSHALMCFYILLRFTKPEYKYLYIFNRKVIYSPKRKIDLINHLS